MRKNDSHNFQIGDVVNLKSGGCLLTVQGWDDSGDIHVVWSDGNGVDDCWVAAGALGLVSATEKE